MASMNGEQVQAALHQSHRLTGMPLVTPEVLEQMYAEQRRGPMIVRDFLAHVALSDREVESGGGGKAAGSGSGRNARRSVTISTIHASKGLEFPVVFVARWCDGYLPTMPRVNQEELERVRMDERDDWIRKEEHEHLEEERRLAHVAVTRAMDRLFVTSIRVHRVQGQAWKVNPSGIHLPADTRLVERVTLPKSQEEANMTAEAEMNEQQARYRQL